VCIYTIYDSYSSFNLNILSARGQLYINIWGISWVKDGRWLDFFKVEKWLYGGLCTSKWGRLKFSQLGWWETEHLLCISLRRRMRCARLPIFAKGTFTKNSAGDTELKAFTIGFLTAWSFTFASSPVRNLTKIHFWSESLRVLSYYLLFRLGHGSIVLPFMSIATANASALLSTYPPISKAFTV
jgi:hypothetical protein